MPFAAPAAHFGKGPAGDGVGSTGLTGGAHSPLVSGPSGWRASPAARLADGEYPVTTSLLTMRPVGDW